MDFPQRFHFTAQITGSVLDCSVIQPCDVDTGVPSLCQPQASDTKASYENVKRESKRERERERERECVCECACTNGWGTHQPATICSFQGSLIADNRLGKQSRSGGSQLSSTFNCLRLCQINYFILSCHYLPVGGQSTPTTHAEGSHLQQKFKLLTPH